MKDPRDTDRMRKEARERSAFGLAPIKQEGYVTIYATGESFKNRRKTKSKRRWNERRHDLKSIFAWFKGSVFSAR